jgi:hypothetical protein
VLVFSVFSLEECRTIVGIKELVAERAVTGRGSTINGSVMLLDGAFSLLYYFAGVYLPRTLLRKNLAARM